FALDLAGGGGFGPPIDGSLRRAAPIAAEIVADDVVGELRRFTGVVVLPTTPRHAMLLHGSNRSVGVELFLVPSSGPEADQVRARLPRSEGAPYAFRA